ncbi:N-acetylglucosaminyldiphosphodolichol N- acetylglucosaminyltransferase Alg13 [Schizosaccharomyces japonicus yFS275]|uniref:UDP-N-acetylglucosamine transferase subunit ALG13 n=1 Tax=Schizosaccharomyces japonicus (strain yFS275 / FY16936) TaxID=402676 RepID=B6K3W7_SCHJY|nr:N-acetylglucosaminyldiphosphodolichol N- acetylglucosaminyltransferase Alg13 [Schizosaccharomyces japonicus yFS275]EEB08174.2 N-acetylglucosaminyldiphosphodolichol N- acetylglucosaminyltransferase Alg13 [Schizosaccharomyces japonicus yFS275]
MFMSVLVTVGSTSFNELIEAVGHKSFYETLVRHGYSRLYVQYGGGKTVFENRDPDVPGLEVTGFDYVADLTPYMEEAQLVVSHAGAGSILQALRRGKRLVIVPNETLMDNHQIELAEKMDSCGYAMRAATSTLAKVVDQACTNSPTPFPEADYSKFRQVMEDVAL